ncbi:BMC domain-containing protein [Neiella sp. HB171785]|uniref:BMC domain-containing protein n=1 Tax=Neiella litorisoli TaxID=2771431 RepID=A0A8J6QTB8_9GAMM|nr:BMC domain-containing protein [Neiella litorisoli]MBD1388657.1 BMC domain-containing protein [Neiella litorisoli]
MTNSIGCIELSSIAVGYAVADAMVKAASIDIIWNEIQCPGRLMLMILGDTASVHAAIEVGASKGRARVVDSLVLSRVHPDVLAAIRKRKAAKAAEALGVVEALTLSSAIQVADSIAKSSSVNIINFNASIGIAGKGVVMFCGDTASVSSAIEIADKYAATRGCTIHSAFIPNPSEQLLARKRL